MPQDKIPTSPGSEPNPPASPKKPKQGGHVNENAAASTDPTLAASTPSKPSAATDTSPTAAVGTAPSAPGLTADYQLKMIAIAKEVIKSKTAIDVVAMYSGADFNKDHAGFKAESERLEKVLNKGDLDSYGAAFNICRVKTIQINLLEMDEIIKKINSVNTAEELQSLSQRYST